jgi:hypothetical protein
MDVQVLYALTAVWTLIGDQTKAAGTILGAEFGRYMQQMAERCRIGIVGILERMARDHQQMNWCLGRQIGEGDTFFVFIDERDGDFAARNFAKDGFRHNFFSAMKHKSRAH